MKKSYPVVISFLLGAMGATCLFGILENPKLWLNFTSMFAVVLVGALPRLIKYFKTPIIVAVIMLPLCCFGQKDTLPPGDTLNTSNGINSFTGLTDIKHVAWMPLERNWYYDFDRWGRPVYYPPIKKDTLPPPDTAKVVLLCNYSNMPEHFEEVFLVAKKAYRVKQYPHVWYFDQKWKRIEQFYEPILKIGW